MAGYRMPDTRPWGRTALTIPPNSTSDWMHLALWEIWIGMLIAMVVGMGMLMILTAPDRIVATTDLSGCYAPPPVATPCERVIYRGGILNAAFTTLCGFLLLGFAGWLLWELWSAVEPKPITDEFLKLLKASFDHDWRNPLKWPWTRIAMAYGFTLVGAAFTVIIATLLNLLITPPPRRVAPNVRTEMMQAFPVTR